MQIQSITLYFVLYFDKNKKKWIKTRYRMERQTAEEQFADTEFEILEDAKEVRSSDPEKSHTGVLGTPRE